MPQSKSLKKRNFAKDERLWEYGVVPYEIDPKISNCIFGSVPFILFYTGSFCKNWLDIPSL